jgi:hypothetical protein
VPGIPGMVHHNLRCHCQNSKGFQPPSIEPSKHHAGSPWQIVLRADWNRPVRRSSRAKAEGVIRHFSHKSHELGSPHRGGEDGQPAQNTTNVSAMGDRHYQLDDGDVVELLQTTFCCSIGSATSLTPNDPMTFRTVSNSGRAVSLNVL